MKYYNKLIKIIVEIQNRKNDGKKTTATILSKKTDTTYTHTASIIKLLEKKGVIKRIKKGRKNFIIILDEDFFKSMSGMYALIKNYEII